MYSALTPDLQKMALCCLHGLVTLDLKIKSNIGNIDNIGTAFGRRLAVGSVNHPYMMYGCVFLYK